MSLVDIFNWIKSKLDWLIHADLIEGAKIIALVLLAMFALALAGQVIISVKSLYTKALESFYDNHPIMMQRIYIGALLILVVGIIFLSLTCILSWAGFNAVDFLILPLLLFSLLIMIVSMVIRKPSLNA